MYDSYATLNQSISGAEYAAIGAVGGAIAGMMLTVTIISAVISILTIIANWKLFSKAGEAGWKCIIPIYNVVTLFKISGISPLWVLGYLAAFIPVVGWFVTIGITIYAMINLAKAFGKEGGFAVGLILLNTIFIMILAFGSSKYQLNKSEVSQ